MEFTLGLSGSKQPKPMVILQVKIDSRENPPIAKQVVISAKTRLSQSPFPPAPRLAATQGRIRRASLRALVRPFSEVGPIDPPRGMR
jgi:hypothetical protein